LTTDFDPLTDEICHYLLLLLSSFPLEKKMGVEAGEEWEKGTEE